MREFGFSRAPVGDHLDRYEAGPVAVFITVSAENFCCCFYLVNYHDGQNVIKLRVCNGAIDLESYYN